MGRTKSHDLLCCLLLTYKNEDSRRKDEEQFENYLSSCVCVPGACAGLCSMCVLLGFPDFISFISRSITNVGYVGHVSCFLLLFLHRCVHVHTVCRATRFFSFSPTPLLSSSPPPPHTHTHTRHSDLHQWSQH